MMNDHEYPRVADVVLAERMAYAEQPHQDFLRSPEFERTIQAQLANIDETERALYRTSVTEMLKDGSPVEDQPTYTHATAAIAAVKISLANAINEMSADVTPYIRDDLANQLRLEKLEAATLASNSISRRHWANRVHKQTPPRPLSGSFEGSKRR